MPDTFNPMAYDRFSYVYNSPLVYIDPTGHDLVFCGAGKPQCAGGGSSGGVGSPVGSGGTDDPTSPTLDFDLDGEDETLATLDDITRDIGLSEADLLRAKLMFYLYWTDPGRYALDEEVWWWANVYYNYAGAEQFGGIAMPLYAEHFGSFTVAQTAHLLMGMSMFATGQAIYSGAFHTAGTMTQAQQLGWCSFSAETLVMTEAGLVPISELEIGDYVLAFNEATGETAYYPITAAWAHDDPVLVLLTVDGEVIETTLEHPFYTQTEEWIAAGSLKVDDYIQKVDGSFGKVQSVKVISETRPMYNLTVATAHTYFVGTGQWLVHNHCGATNAQLQTQANNLGYTQRISPPKAPFNSHGQTVYYNPKTKTYITHDVDGHSGGYWKMFDRSGNRIGTWNQTLTVKIGK